MRPGFRLVMTAIAALCVGASAAVPAAASPGSLEEFSLARVGDQPATSLVASYPTTAQITAVMAAAACTGQAAECLAGTPEWTQYVAYYGDRTTGGFTMRPGFVSGVGAEYAAETGPGSLKISVSSYASSRQAALAAGGIARSAGVPLRRVARISNPAGPWGSYEVWTGTSAEGDQGVIYGFSGNRYVRAWIYPPSKQWSARQWRVTLQGVARLLPQVMGARAGVALTPELQALVPPTPASLRPVFVATQGKSAWLPYGRPDRGLYDSMGPRQVSLQYAIVGAPETLALNASITPVADTVLAQQLVDRLPSGQGVSGAEPIDGLPAGAQSVHYDENGVERLIYVQFVAKGALNELTCSDLSVTSDLVAGRAECISAIVAAATALASGSAVSPVSSASAP